MGIERARVTEVHATDSVSGRAGSGYQITDRLVLTSGRLVGRHGPTVVRPGGTAVWATASVGWRAPGGEAAILDVHNPSVLVPFPGPIRWGRISGVRPVAVTAIGFAPSDVRPVRARDVEQFLGHVATPEGEDRRATLTVTPSGHGALAADGMSGAALFAGPELVGVLLASTEQDGRSRLCAAPVAYLSADPAFVALVGGPGGLTVTSVTTAWSGLPILPAR